MRRFLLAVMAFGVLAAGYGLLAPRSASAHPLGNFTVNRYSRIELSPGQARIRYVLDLAEIPAFQEKGAIDTDRDGRVSDAEAAAYAGRTVEELRRNLRLSVDGQPVELRTAEHAIGFPAGQGGLDTLRLEVWYEAALPASDAVRSAGFRDDNYRDRLGWKEIVVQGGPGIAVSAANVAAIDESDELRSYPDSMLKSPLNQREATFSFAPGEGSTVSSGERSRGLGVMRRQDRFAELITRELSVQVLLLSLLIAMGLGALHALGPGHGKTVVAAYLVGSRGTSKHAIFLGLTVTLTHTSSVFALGLVTLYLSEYILPEQLFPWLSFASGAFIALLGATLLVGRARTLLARLRRTAQRPALAPAVSHSRVRNYQAEAAHSHDGFHGHHHHGGTPHSHMPPGATGERVTWRSLLALGISGGILPCPSALVVLLTAISIHRIGYGMLLIFAFSLGLASVLTGIGLLLVHARSLFSRLPFDSAIARVAPVLSAAVVTVLGLAIAVRALVDNGKISV